MKSVEEMKELQDAIGNAVVVIEDLSTSLEQVGEATDMIESIADHMNLLALNAAIEAVRAGKNMQSFAVTAEELQKIAKNSKKSPADIGSMIKTLQDEMSKVIRTSDAISHCAEAGRGDLDKVVASVKITAGVIEDIKGRMGLITDGFIKGADGLNVSASSTENAYSAIEQLNSGIEKLSGIFKHAAHTVAKFELKESV